jgi:hypothetical protein
MGTRSPTSSSHTGKNSVPASSRCGSLDSSAHQKSERSSCVSCRSARR